MGYEFDTFKLHKGMLVILITTIWVFTIISWIINEHNSSVICIAIAFVVYLFLSFCIALLAFMIAKMRHNKTVRVVIDWNFIKQILSHLNSLLRLNSNTFLYIVTFVMSPSWLWSDIFKKNIKGNNHFIGLRGKKVIRKEFIAYKNLLNVLISVLLIVAMHFGKQSHSFSFGYSFLVGLIIYRVLSRSLEIIIAFGDDAFSMDKKSTLKSYERIILAITSLFECILNYALAYYLIGDGVSLFRSFVNSLQCSTLYTCNYLSESTCALSNMSDGISPLDWLQITQILTSLTLIFLSLAIYISDSGKKKNIRVSEISITRRRK